MTGEKAEFGQLARRRKWVSVPALLFVIGLMGWGFYTQSASVTETERTVFMMDTVVQLRAVGRHSDAAVDAAVEEMRRVENVFSRFDSDSEIAIINRQAGSWTPVTAEVAALIEKGLGYGHLTEGAFDITIGALMNLWGFHTESPSVPAHDELERVLTLVDFARVELDFITEQVRIPPNYILDLGGIAKGYAVDRGRGVLLEHGMVHGMINAGGDIAVIGERPGGGGWRVGIQDPVDSGSILAVVELTDMAIVTSGDYERFFEANGARYHHILDPRTGYPADGLRSVTIVAPSATASDALSTAVFVLGWSAGQTLIQKLDDVEAVLVNGNDDTWTSPGLKRDVTFR